MVLVALADGDRFGLLEDSDRRLLAPTDLDDLERGQRRPDPRHWEPVSVLVGQEAVHRDHGGGKPARSGPWPGHQPQHAQSLCRVVRSSTPTRQSRLSWCDSTSSTASSVEDRGPASLEPPDPEPHVGVAQQCQLSRVMSPVQCVTGVRSPAAGTGARRAPVVVEHEALVDEAAEQVEHLARSRSPGAATRLGRVERERPGEDAEPAQDAPAPAVEEVVAPVDRRGQGLLPGQRGPRAAGEQPEAVVEVARRSARRSAPAAGRGQLERQRDAVEPPADLGDRRRLSSVTANDGPRPPRPLDEQPHRLVLDSAGTASEPSGGGAGSEGTRQVTSPGTPSGSRLVARTETAAPGEQRRRPAGAGVDQVLAVVQHEQRRPAAAPRASVPRSDRPLASPHAERRQRPRPTAPGSATRRARPTTRPPGTGPTRSAATSSASRVLPTPPAPVSVTSRSADQLAHERGELGARPISCQLHRQVVAEGVE